LFGWHVQNHKETNKTIDVYCRNPKISAGTWIARLIWARSCNPDPASGSRMAPPVGTPMSRLFRRTGTWALILVGVWTTARFDFNRSPRFELKPENVDKYVCTVPSPIFAQQMLKNLKFPNCTSKTTRTRQFFLKMTQFCVASRNDLAFIVSYMQFTNSLLKKPVS
jgi:hypothetical protein